MTSRVFLLFFDVVQYQELIILPDWVRMLMVIIVSQMERVLNERVVVEN